MLAQDADHVVEVAARRPRSRGRPSRRRRRRVIGVSTTWSRTSSVWPGLGQAERPVEDLGVGLVVLQGHADRRQRAGPERVGPVELRRSAAGSRRATGRTSGLSVTQASSAATAPASAVQARRRPASAAGTGPSRTPDSAASVDPARRSGRARACRSAPTMIAAVIQASTWPHQGVANAPMFRRFDVKWISGITANESCRLRITWLRTSSCCVDPSPASADHHDRRDQGEQPGDQPPQPGGDPQVEVALHHDLAGERPRQRRALPGAQQGDAEQDRRRRAEERRAAACAPPRCSPPRRRGGGRPRR